jgi:hypothetical protein
MIVAPVEAAAQAAPASPLVAARLQAITALKRQRSRRTHGNCSSYAAAHRQQAASAGNLVKPCSLDANKPAQQSRSSPPANISTAGNKALLGMRAEANVGSPLAQVDAKDPDCEMMYRLRAMHSQLLLRHEDLHTTIDQMSAELHAQRFAHEEDVQQVWLGVAHIKVMK